MGVSSVYVQFHTLPPGVSPNFLIGILRSTPDMQPKVGQSRSIRALYTLRLQPSLLGHDRELCWECLPDATSASVSNEKKKAYLCDLCLRHDHSHRWRAAQGQRSMSTVNSCDEPLACHESLKPYAINWLLKPANQEIKGPTGESGMWSSSLEKELLKALLNVSLFCLCRSIVARITYG